MATHDYNIANQTGANFRADLNNALSAILSNNASDTEPTTTTAYMLWVDTTNNLLKMRNSADNAWITLPVSITTSNTVDIDGGTVNTITSLSFSSGETVTTILDEDDLSSDSASALATQQSIKAYVDSQVTAQDLDFQGDTGGALSIDLDSETFTISGGNGIDTSGALNTLTIAIDSSVVTLTDTQTLTNKTIDADSNTISNLEVDNLKSGVLDTDLTSVSASDDTLASSKAIKTYVDAQVTAQDLDLTDGTTSISIDLDSEELSVLGGTGVTSTASGNGVTLAIGQDVGTTADVTFNTVAADLTGDVTGTVSSIANHSTSDLSEGTNLYYTTARFDSAFSGKSTSDLTEGSNLYFTDERVDDRVNNLLVAGSNVTLTYDDVANTLTIAATEDNLSNNDTDDLAEGSTNLYYTDARARAAISASGDLSYNSTTGVISFTERTDAEVRGLISASGDLSYNSTTGVFSFTERTDAEVRGLISASGDLSYNSTTGVMSFTERTDAEVRGLISGGTGVTYNNTTGVISIGQAVGTSDNVTFGDVIVSGDLTVSGTTTTVNTETINLADNIILFNSNATGTPTENAGIEIERGDATNKTLLWNETDDKWTVGSETFVAGTFEGNVTGNVTGTVSSLANHDTDDLSEGASNLYYTTARFDSAFSGKSTSDLTEGTNLYYTTARANSDFDTRLATKSTTDLAEGTNLYYTDARFDTRLAAKTTDNLTEGSTNLYYADSLVDSHLSGGTGVTYSSGTISIGQAVGTGDSVTFAGVSSDFTGDIEGAVKFTAKADVALTKGQVVYISGISGDVPTVNLADADNASAMPAFGLVYANANQNAEVEIITFGSLSGFDTSSFTVGKTVYVSTTAGALTTTAPTGESSLIQNIGMVQRSHATAGIIKVGGAGRTNATPNLNSGKIFYGNGSNQSVATTLDTSIVPENTNLYYTDARANSAIDARVTKSFVDALGVAALTATTLATARDFSLTGDVTASGVSFDGSGNVALTTSIGSNTVGITELNVTDGTSGQVLTTDGAGTLSFSDAAAGYSDSDVETYLDTGTSTPTFSTATVTGDLTVDTSTLYVDSTNNRVGIGTTSVQSPLHVAAGSPTIRLEDTDGGYGLVSGLNGNVRLRADEGNTEAASFIGFEIDGTEEMRLTSTGLGINTISPSGILHLDMGTPDIVAELSANSPTFTYRNGSGSWFHAGKHPTNDYFYIGRGATTTTNVDMIFDNSGQLGIGVTNVGAPLDIGTSNPKLRLTDSDGGYSEVRGNGGVITLVADAGNAVASSAIAFEVDNVEKVRIDSSGNLGVGLSVPSTKLHVYQSTVGSDAAYIRTNSGAGQNDTAITNTHFVGGDTSNVRNTVLRVQTIRSNTGDNRQAVLQVEDYGSNARALKLDADRLIFAEHSGSNTDLSILAKSGYLYALGGTSGLVLGDDASQGTRILMSTGSNYMRFDTNGSERMRITSDGYALLGRSNDFGSLGYRLQVDNDQGTNLILVTSGNTSTKTALVMRDKNQAVAAGSITFDDLAAQYNTSSDYRLKENIQPLANGLARVQQLNPVQFDWIGTGKTSEGFIAHEAQEVFAEAVSGEKDGKDMQGMDYGRITPLLVKAIQEQQVLIEQLQAEVALLKGE